MSEFKIKVGLKLDDDLKELIRKEIMRQLQEHSNYSIVMNSDNYIWSKVCKDGKSSELTYTPEGLYCCNFRKNNNEDDIDKLKHNHKTIVESVIFNKDGSTSITYRFNN